MIIGLVGFISSGKSTVATYLNASYEFNTFSFADSLKNILADIFGWDRISLEGLTQQDRDWRNCVDTWWATRLNIPDLTPRKMLQNIGTDLFRQQFHDEIWIASLENKLKNVHDNIVVTDCRFPNEIQAIKRLGGIIVKVSRESNPDWYNNILKLNTDTQIDDITRQKELNKLQVHSSEIAWIGQEIDYEINNNGSVVNLYEQVDLIINQALSLPDAK